MIVVKNCYFFNHIISHDLDEQLNIAKSKLYISYTCDFYGNLYITYTIFDYTAVIRHLYGFCEFLYGQQKLLCRDVGIYNPI